MSGASEADKRQLPGGPESPFPLPLEDDRLTPNAVAERCASLLPELLARRDATKDRRERKDLSRRIRSLRSVLSWAKTRAGYRS